MIEYCKKNKKIIWENDFEKKRKENKTLRLR